MNGGNWRPEWEGGRDGRWGGKGKKKEQEIGLFNVCTYIYIYPVINKMRRGVDQGGGGFVPKTQLKLSTSSKKFLTF